MSIKIIDKIFNDLKDKFEIHKIREQEIELIKDMIVFKYKNYDEKMVGECGDEKVCLKI
jgi:hypothetical protein